MDNTSREWKRSVLAPLSMLLTQVILTGMLVLSKITLSHGASVYSFLTYHSLTAALFMVPFSLLFERKMIKKLSWPIVLWIFINATTGITIGIGFYYCGLQDTFALSLLVRIEKPQLHTCAGRTKIFGAFLSAGGAMLMTLYKGKELYSSPSASHKLTDERGEHHWKRGTLFLIGGCFSAAFWYLGQVKLFNLYPSKLWATTLTCAVGSLQSLVVGVIINRSWSAWKLGWDLQLLTIIYSGVLTTGALFYLTTWVTTIRGPAYPTIFNALSLVFIVVIETSAMRQELYLGSLLGIILIIGGIATFLWAKAKDSSTSESENSQGVSHQATRENL